MGVDVSANRPAVTLRPPREVDSTFTDFYEREFELQVRRAFLLLGSNDDAHDVVQNAMAAIYRRWGTLENPGGYLTQAVLNGCRDAGRRRASRQRLLVRVAERDAVEDRGEVLDDVLAGLPFNQRAAVVLRYYASMTTQEIATALGCPAGSVGPWIDRALSKMRKAMQ
jgi:RNA polymerase sigma factor (sigma-70 family)